jgi:hypothetical protein
MPEMGVHVLPVVLVGSFDLVRSANGALQVLVVFAVVIVTAVSSRYCVRVETTFFALGDGRSPIPMFIKFSASELVRSMLQSIQHMKNH